jgi:hypothetical protein
MSWWRDVQKGRDNPSTGTYVPPSVENKNAFWFGQRQAWDEDWRRRKAQEEADQKRKNEKKW